MRAVCKTDVKERNSRALVGRPWTNSRGSRLRAFPLYGDVCQILGSERHLAQKARITRDEGAMCDVYSHFASHRHPTPKKRLATGVLTSSRWGEVLR